MAIVFQDGRQRSTDGAAYLTEPVQTAQPDRDIDIGAFVLERDPRAAVVPKARHLLPQRGAHRAKQHNRRNSACRSTR